MSDSPPSVGDVTAAIPELNVTDISPKDTSSLQGSAPVSPNTSALSCEMCQNYETNLTIMQDNERKLKEEMAAVKALSDRYQSELATEREYRLDLEKKMAEKAATIEDVISEAAAGTDALIAEMKKTEQAADATREETRTCREETRSELSQLETRNRELEAELASLSEQYLDVLGRKRAAAAEMRAETIEIPQDTDKLQFEWLSWREQLIESRAGREHEVAELKNECASLREQVREYGAAREATESELTQQINQLSKQLGVANSQLSSAADSILNSEQRSRQIRDMQQTIEELEQQVAQVQSERAAVEQTMQNYKARCHSLQAELDTSEQVQKDFVQLSQSLQIQLEKIRQSEQEVRWQWDEDVSSCPECCANVSRIRPRPRCHHCGKVFCGACVAQAVPCGPSRRPAPVCRVCHTLLNRDSAPFFSKD